MKVKLNLYIVPKCQSRENISYQELPSLTKQNLRSCILNIETRSWSLQSTEDSIWCCNAISSETED
jgi:hypothetical protein